MPSPGDRIRCRGDVAGGLAVAELLQHQPGDVGEREGGPFATQADGAWHLRKLEIRCLKLARVEWLDRDDVGIDDVAGIESVDRRSEVLALVGGPDAFVISLDEVGGEVSRLESWSYYEAESQIDFIDGEILWDVEIDDVPDGMLLPLGFTPTEFTMLSSVDEVLAGLEGVELEPLVEAAAEFEVEGAELWVGEQLALVFIDDALVYVEAFALAVDDQVVVP